MKLRSCRSLWFGMLIAAVFRPGGGPAARADFIATLTSSKDTMIFQNNPNNSLGGGMVMYAGTNSAPSIRRGLFAFDIADHIPQGAIIASAQLTLTYAAASGGGAGGGGGGGGNTGSPNSFDIGIYRLLANWGEGIVGTGTGTSGVGQGQPANPGDATWSHAFWNTTPWSNPGGDFVSTASAVTPVGGLTLNVPFTW